MYYVIRISGYFMTEILCFILSCIGIKKIKNEVDVTKFNLIIIVFISYGILYLSILSIILHFSTDVTYCVIICRFLLLNYDV